MVAGDVTAVAAAVAPHVAAAVSAYGAGVVARVQEAAVDATAGMGGRLLRRLLGRTESAPAVEAAVRELAEGPDDEDRLAALRLQIRRVLAADPVMAADVEEILGGAGVSVIASGERSVAAQTISGIASTGDRATIQR
jgi:hypothetical protein